ncbi:unnamed protein product [Closterium sp. Yama58-4]|nr:unnamed protein product [Closterium sp. Yama58-4]
MADSPKSPGSWSPSSKSPPSGNSQGAYLGVFGSGKTGGSGVSGVSGGLGANGNGSSGGISSSGMAAADTGGVVGGGVVGGESDGVPMGPHVHHHVTPDGRVVAYETVQDRLLNVFRKAAGYIWSFSHTVARVDVVRPITTSHRRRRYYDNDDDGRGPGGGLSSSYFGARDSSPVWRARRQGRRGGRRDEDEEGGLIQGINHGLYGEGARLKLMQIWDFPDKETGKPRLPYGLNFGVGANYEVNGSRLEPKLRIRTPHVALHLLPEPDIELRWKWRLGTTNVALDVRYTLPLRSFDRFWDRAAGVGLSVNLFNPIGTGFHLSPGGLEFDEQVVKLGKHTKLRLAATFMFPKHLPLEEDEEPIRNMP